MLKLNEQIRSSSLEFYGMLFYLLSKEKDLIVDVVADHGGWEQLDVTHLTILHIVTKMNLESNTESQEYNKKGNGRHTSTINSAQGNEKSSM